MKPRPGTMAWCKENILTGIKKKSWLRKVISYLINSFPERKPKNVNPSVNKCCWFKGCSKIFLKTALTFAIFITLYFFELETVRSPSVLFR